jgi:hypothetical protein
MSADDFSDLTIGVLAIQGAVEEHISCLKKLGVCVRTVSLHFHLVLLLFVYSG